MGLRPSALIMADVKARLITLIGTIHDMHHTTILIIKRSTCRCNEVKRMIYSTPFTIQLITRYRYDLNKYGIKYTIKVYNRRNIGYARCYSRINVFLYGGLRYFILVNLTRECNINLTQYYLQVF